MTIAQFASKVRRRTQTDSTVYPDAQLLVDANLAIDRLSAMVNERDSDILGLIETTTLNASGTTIDDREYALPEGYHDMIRLMIYPDGTDVEPLELPEVSTILNTQLPYLEEEIVSKFSNTRGNAGYEIFRGHIRLYTGTLTEVAAGMRIEYLGSFNRLTDMTATTALDTPIDSGTSGFAGINRDFTDVLINMVTREYKLDNNFSSGLTKQEDWDYIQRQIIDAISLVKSRNKKREYPYRGEKRYNEGMHGFNL